MDYRYYVVHFSDPPYCDIDQYVCIPDSWIQLREIVDQVVVTKFPVENLSITKKRVKDGEVFSDDWSIYVAEVKYGTDAYNDAEKYIERLKEELINKQNCSGLVNNGDRLSKLSKSFKRRSKRNQSNLSVNKPQICEAPSNDSIEPESEPIAVIRTEIETPKIQTNRVETITSANLSAESLHDKQLLSNTEHYLYPYRVSVRQENNDETLNNVDTIRDNNRPEGTAGNESPANHDGPQLTNESLDAIVTSEPISDTGKPSQVKNARGLYFEKDFLLLLDQTCDGYFQCCKSLEKLMDKLNSQYYCGSYKPFNPTIKDAVAPVVEEKEREEKEIEKKRKVLKRTQAEVGIIKRREAERNEQEIDNNADNDDGDDDDNGDDDDYVKRKRFQSRTLTLPPEYDKNDSKWTLRYREYAPGLVELIEHTGVYINAVKLVNCKRLAQNSKRLARLLLVEIFTESALCTCSLTGVRAKAFDTDGTHVKPGLDENARIVLLTYVEQYAQANKWPKTDNQSILNSIRNKMQEFRFKCIK